MACMVARTGKAGAQEMQPDAAHLIDGARQMTRVLLSLGDIIGLAILALFVISICVVAMKAFQPAPEDRTD